MADVLLEKKKKKKTFDAPFPHLLQEIEIGILPVLPRKFEESSLRGSVGSHMQ